MKKINLCMPLFIILLLALILRSPGLNLNFSGDEIDIIGPARNFLTTGDFRLYNDINNTPVFNYSHPPMRILLYTLWAYIFGLSNIAIRFLPMIFGLLSIIVIYMIGRELYSKNIGIIAAFLAAVSRYHVYASTTIATDSGNFIFTTSAAVLFFIMYFKYGSRNYLAASFAFTCISILTKFSAVMIFIPILVLSYFYKKTFYGISYSILSIVFSMTCLFIFSIFINDARIFTDPLSTLSYYSTGGVSLPSDYIYNKIFKLATVTWQMTPFLAVLTILSLYRLRKERNFWILSSWLIGGFLTVFIPYGGDSQRYFIMMLPPLFLLIASYADSIKLEMFTIASFAAFIILSLTLNLNDIMGYYEPAYLGIFYLLALASLFAKKHTKNILIGGFLGLSIFFALMPNSNTFVTSDAVGSLSEKALNYPYKEVWSSKDISYYITPVGDVVHSNQIPDLEFFKKENLENNNVKYLVFYSAPDEKAVLEAMKFCEDTYVHISFGHTIGFACKIKTV